MQQYLNERVRVFNLKTTPPDMKSSLPFGFLESSRGTLAPLMIQNAYKYLAVIGFKAGIARGGHYHKQKREMMYVIEGTLTLRVSEHNLLSNPTELTLCAGDLVELDTGIWHEYIPLADAIALDISPDPYIDGDTYIQ